MRSPLSRTSLARAAARAAGRAGVQDDAARAPGMTAGHAVGRDERVLHARGQLGALAEHAHVAHDARAAPVVSRAARVRTHRVALHPEGEIALDVLDGIVLLGDVVDDVDAVGERTSAEPHAEPLDAQDGRIARRIPGAEVVQHVDRRARGHAAAIGLGEGAKMQDMTRKRVCARMPRGAGKRGFRCSPRASPTRRGSEQPLVDVELGRATADTAKAMRSEPGIGHEVDRPAAWSSERDPSRQT